MTNLSPRFPGFLPDGVEPPFDDVLVTGQAPPDKRSHDGLLTVLGVEDRRQETETELSPWRMISSLKITTNAGSMIGTGWFVGPSTVLTAGHCISHRGQKAHKIEIIPARDDARQPFGSISVGSERMDVHERWENGAEPARDVGVLHLPGKPGLKTGWFGIIDAPDESLDGCLVNVGGYPGAVFSNTDHERVVNGRELWWHRDAITKLDAERIHYVIDTSGGQSGGPVFTYSKDDNRPIGVAVHAYGVARAMRHSPVKSNSATRIDSALADLIENWRATSVEMADQE